jgi:hypothetical protein
MKCGKKMALISSVPNVSDKVNKNIWQCEPCDERMETVGPYKK